MPGEQVCRARVEALMAAGPELRKWLDYGQERKEEYTAKRAEAGAEPSEEQRATSPPDATAAAGSSAVPVQCEGATAEDEAMGIARRLVKWEPAD